MRYKYTARLEREFERERKNAGECVENRDPEREERSSFWRNSVDE